MKPVKKRKNERNTTSNFSCNGLGNNSLVYHVGDYVRIKDTGAIRRVSCILACGENGHSEIRYYLNRDKGYPRHADELEAPPPKAKGGNTISEGNG